MSKDNNKNVHKKNTEVNKKQNKESSGNNKSIVKWIIAFIAELVILGLMIVGYSMYYLDSKIEKINKVEINEEDLAINEELDVTVQENYKTIALFGVDSRDVTNLGQGTRSDSIMIASINNDTKEVKIVSIYRDTLLEIENDSGITSKVNAAYAYGGPQLAIKTLNANLDLQITDFVTVNFLGLTKAIDDLGGITVHVEENELPILNMAITEQIAVTGIYSDGVFTTGDLTLNGTQATAYARIRSTDQGDITRTERQRDVITKIFEKTKSSDLSTIDSIIDDVFPEIATSLTEDEIKSLAKAVFEYQLGDTVGFPFAYTPITHDTKGSILVPADLASNVSALHEFLFGETGYVPTGKVQSISSSIQNETGIAAQPITVIPQTFE
ncbi:MAG: LCP family protein [Lachnospiraceae bacterium]|nr:LCP family protein [Lachnospiraceae bacterium]